MFFRQKCYTLGGFELHCSDFEPINMNGCCCRPQKFHLISVKIPKIFAPSARMMKNYAFALLDPGLQGTGSAFREECKSMF